MRSVRGKDIAMVFQEPMTSLDPSFTIGSQMTETILAHGSRDEAGGEATGDRDARARRDPAGGDAVRRLPAPVLRRHAPAGDDRDGAPARAQAAHRRRADDGARRHDPGSDPRPARRSARRPRDERDPDHAQPRGRQRDRRPRRGDVRRRDRRGRHGEPRSSTTPGTPTPRG